MDVLVVFYCLTFHKDKNNISYFEVKVSMIIIIVMISDIRFHFS